MNFHAELTKKQWGVRMASWLLVIVSLLTYSKVEQDWLKIMMVIFAFTFYRIGVDIGSPFPKKTLIQDYIISIVIFSGLLLTVYVANQPIVTVIGILIFMIGYWNWMKRHYTNIVVFHLNKAIESNDKSDIDYAMKLLSYNRNFKTLKDKEGQLYYPQLEALYNKMNKDKQ